MKAAEVAAMEMEATEAAEAEEVLKPLYQSNGKDVIIDCTNLEYIASSGMTISINRLYFSYMEEGWDAVRSNLEKYTRRDDRGARRNRGIDYEARLTPEGVALYRKLRELRGRIAMSKQLPPYFIFMNRSLYEMCCRQPDSMEELLELYGVGEKNSSEHGEEFLEEIRKFTGGKKRQLAKIP